MYEKYTRQALPSREYRELIGSAICVFNSNNAFIIENILKNDTNKEYSWYDLIDRTSGRLISAIHSTISSVAGDEIATVFDELVKIRNRIVHSYRVTDSNGDQVLCTKDDQNIQYIITEDYLYKFINKNEKLSDLLHKFRGY